MELIIGNLCSIAAMITDSISSAQKTTQGVLGVQCISQAIYGLSSFLLKGYSAVVQSAVSIVRNLLAMQKKQFKWMEYVLIAAGVVLGLYFNNRGLFGWLPVLANFEYSVAIFKFKDNEHALKIAFAFNIIMFMIFNAIILNIVGVCTAAVVLVSTVSAIFAENKKRKAAK